jgi:hypothetical protein
LQVNSSTKSSFRKISTCPNNLYRRAALAMYIIFGVKYKKKKLSMLVAARVHVLDTSELEPNCTKLCA